MPSHVEDNLSGVGQDVLWPLKEFLLRIYNAWQREHKPNMNISGGLQTEISFPKRGGIQTF